jgi:hypothetical protein
MRFWSKGLGERELDIELDKSDIVKEEGKAVLRGTLKAPVTWNYEVTLFNEDTAGIFRVMFSVPGIVYFLKNISGVGTFISKRGEMGPQPAEATSAGATGAKSKPAEGKASDSKAADLQTAEVKPKENTDS